MVTVGLHSEEDAEYGPAFFGVSHPMWPGRGWVSERGLEPPRGVKPHQVLSLTSLTFPSGASATQCHSSYLGASQCNKVEIVVLVRGALRVPRQETLGTRSSGIRSVGAPGLQPRVPLPWSLVLVQLLSSDDTRLQHLHRLESVSGVIRGVIRDTRR